MLLLLWLSAAWADEISLDDGATFEGRITRWSDGECAAILGDGPLKGLTVEIPCERIVAFEREKPAPIEAPAPTPTLAAVATPPPEPLPLSPPTPQPPVPPPAAAPLPPAAPSPVAEPPPAADAVPEDDTAPKTGLKAALAAEWAGVKDDLGIRHRASDEEEPPQPH